MRAAAHAVSSVSLRVCKREHASEWHALTVEVYVLRLRVPLPP